MVDYINVQIIDMDVMIPEQITQNPDGGYTIFLNARHTQENRALAYKHALEHIEHGDFDLDCGNVQEIEAVAHEIIKPAPTQPEPPVPQAVNTNQKPKRKKRTQRKPQDRYQIYDRAEFLAEHFDVFALAEHQYLYGKYL